MDAEPRYDVGNERDFLVISTSRARLTLNYPNSWLARRIWRFFGFVWEREQA